MLITPRRAAAVALLLPLAMAACSNASNNSTQPDTAAAKPVAATPAPARKTDAKTVLAKLTAGGLPISNGAVQDENTDPNNLIGRPNGYTSRASFDVPGGKPDGDKYDIDRGGVIEVWADAAAAKTRADYLTNALKNMPILGTEYHYLRGPVLVRISGKVKPSVATGFETAAAALPS
jgi:hypothetical protein